MTTDEAGMGARTPKDSRPKGTRKKAAKGAAPRRVSAPDAAPHSTKDRILYAALQLLRDKGFDGFSASELSRATSLSKATLFHHFDSMDAITLACTELLGQAAPTPVKAAKFSTLRAYLSAYGERAADVRANQGYFRLMHFFSSRAMSSPAYAAAMQAAFAHKVDLLADVMAVYLPGNLSRDAIVESAASLELLLSGLAEHRALFDDVGRLKEMWPNALEAEVARLGNAAEVVSHGASSSV